MMQEKKIKVNEDKLTMDDSQKKMIASEVSLLRSFKIVIFVFLSSLLYLILRIVLEIGDMHNNYGFLVLNSIVFFALALLVLLQHFKVKNLIEAKLQKLEKNV